MHFRPGFRRSRIDDRQAGVGLRSAAYLARLDATRAELVKKTLADSKTTLARLDELVTIGTVALREYGAKNPKSMPS